MKGMIKGNRFQSVGCGIQTLKTLMKNLLSNYYKEHNQQTRQALFIQLPDGVWCMDGLASGDPTKKGWTVTGEPPNITVAPSINSNRGNRKGYHGFLQNGVLTDDLEGRTYDDNR
jgi:hypothetical protein